MYFGESSGDVGPNKIACVRQRFLGRKCLPAVGTEVVATQDDAVFRQSMSSRQIQNEPPKIPRFHPCITAELVHLVRRSLYQEVAIVVERLQNRGLYNQRMSRANRVDAHGFAGLVPLHGVQQ